MFSKAPPPTDGGGAFLLREIGFVAFLKVHDCLGFLDLEKLYQMEPFWIPIRNTR